jgi:hypothetical protein
VAAFFDFADRQPAGFAYILAAHPVEMTRLKRQPLPLELFKRVMRTGVDAGVFRPLEPVLAIGWIVAMTQRSILLHRGGRIELPREEIIRHTIDGVMRLVGKVDM